MGPAAPPPTLNRLRQTLAGLDPSLAPRLAGRGASRWRWPRRSTGARRRARLRRAARTRPRGADPSRGRERICPGARGAGERRPRPGALDRNRFRGGRGRRALWPRPRPVRPGLARLLMLRVPRAGRCALGDGGGAALPRARLRHRRTDRRRRGRRSHRDAPARARRARRRARRPRACLLRHRATPMPSAAATRWEIAASSEPSPTPTAGSAARASTSRFARTGADRPAGGSSPGIIMSAPSRRRYLSVWLRRLSTDRIERRLSAPADGPRVVVASIKRRAAHHRAERRRGAARAQGRHGARRRARHVSVAAGGGGRFRGRPAAARSDRRLVRPLHAAGRARSAGRARCSTSPAARICSAARLRWRAI